MKDNRSLPEIEQEILKSANKGADKNGGAEKKNGGGESSSMEVDGSSTKKEKEDVTTTTVQTVSATTTKQQQETTKKNRNNTKGDDDTGSLTTMDRPSASSSSSGGGRMLEGWMSSFQSGSSRSLDLNDSERIRASVEPLPSTTTGVRSSSGVPGAHNVQSPASIAVTRSPRPPGSLTEQQQDDDIVSTLDIETGSHLVEAHLVDVNNDDDDGLNNNGRTTTGTGGGGGDDNIEADANKEELVHAEKLIEPPQPRRLQFALGFAALAIVILVVLVIALLTNGGDNNSNNNNNPDIDTIDGSITPQVGEEDRPFVADTTNASIISEEEEEVPLLEEQPNCFGSSEELYKATTTYFDNPSPNSTTALQYGYPIGSWCVSNIWNFGFMMKATRNHYDVADNDDGSSSHNNTTTTTQKESHNNDDYTYHNNFSDDIGDWDMSNAQQLEEMFHGNQQISTDLGIDRWDLSRTTSLRGMFMETQWQQQQTKALDLSSWNTSSVKNVAQLFRKSNVEVAGVANWDTSQVTILWQFANEATSFNEDISQWNVQRVTSITGAFQGTQNFHQNINQWKTSSLIRMNMAFLNSTFNQPLNGWDVSKVETLRGTFKDSAFNQDINDWDVANVNVLRQAFDTSSFNQDIANWDVSKVVDARWMFTGATNFSQNLCAWGSKLPPNVLVDGMFKNTACPNTSDPIIPDGPFCFNCYST